MTKSDIIIELEENIGEMNQLIENQKFTVGDAQKYLERYFNILRKMEQLTISRDIWRRKFERLKKAQLNAKAGGKNK